MSNVDFEDEPQEVEQEVPEIVDDESADDAVDIDAAGEDEEVVAEASDDDTEEQEEAPRRSRENDRIRTLRERAETERIRAERLDQELRDIRAQEQARSRQRETETERAERMALMSPEERSEFRLNEALEKNRLEMAAMQFRMEDQSDRAAFHAKATADAFYGKWADKVEAARAEFLKQGTVVPREQLLRWLVGNEVIATRGRGTSRQVQRGKENIRRQQAPAVRGKADTQAQRRQADSPAKRLEGVLI